MIVSIYIRADRSTRITHNPNRSMARLCTRQQEYCREQPSEKSHAFLAQARKHCLHSVELGPPIF